MGPEIFGVLLLLLVVAYIVFKLIRKIVAIIITMVTITLLVLIGLGLLVWKDIQAFQDHPTKELLMVLSSEDETAVYSAAVFSPKGQRTRKPGPDESENSSSPGENQGPNKDFELLDGKSLKKIHTDFIEKHFDELVREYVKVIIVKPSSVPLLIKTEVTVFDLPFHPNEIVALIESDAPQALLAQKTLDEKKIRIANLLKVLKSDSTIKGGVFFGAIFDQIRTDHVSFVVGLVKSLSERKVLVHEETLVFRIMTYVPIGLAGTLLDKISDAFGEGKIRIPNFGGSLRESSLEQSDEK